MAPAKASSLARLAPFLQPYRKRIAAAIAALIVAAGSTARPFPLPPFPKRALIAFPFRFLRNRAGDLRRYLRDKRTGSANGFSWG